MKWLRSGAWRRGMLLVAAAGVLTASLGACGTRGPLTLPKPEADAKSNQRNR